ncbi:MAG: hypothetical protein ACSHW4_14895 [Cellulophaga sp.]
MNGIIIISLLLFCAFLIFTNLKIKSKLNEYNSVFSIYQKNLEAIKNKIKKETNKFEKIENDISLIKIQKVKEILNIKEIPTDDYVNLTISQFREITNNLIQNMENSTEKDAIINFLKIDLSFIDLSKAIFDNLILERKVEIEKQVAVITDSGKIEWCDISNVSNVKLVIGQPIKRNEYYNKIIILIQKNISF